MSDDSVVGSDGEWEARAVPPPRSRGRARVPPRRRALIVAVQNPVFRRPVREQLVHDLVEKLPPLAGQLPLVLGVVWLAWEVSTRCSVDLHAAREIALATLFDPPRLGDIRAWVDYLVVDTGWVAPCPYIVGNVGEA